MTGLFRNTPGVKEGKYLVTRRDGTVPEWAWFVLGSADPASIAALRAYADKAEELGFDAIYVKDIRDLAGEWEADQSLNSAELRPGRQPPDGPRHRKDDPATVARMAKAKGS